MQSDETKALEQLIYISSATYLMSKQDLTLLLFQAQRTNSQNGVSGMLLYSEGFFIQLLEGTKEALDSTFARILCDPRHHCCQVLLRQNVSARLFENWFMGFESISRQQLEDLPDYVDFFGDCPIPERGVAAFQLLSTFRSSYQPQFI